MTNNLIAVIIPVYNVDKFLGKCLNSILSQTYQNWVAILVDDCSTDSSGKICDEYAKKDSRFHVIHKKQNENLPNARKTGANYARKTGANYARKTGANYINFVDSDDYVDSEYLATMADGLNENNVDIYYTGATMKDVNGNGVRKVAVPKTDILITDKKKILMAVFAEVPNNELGGHGYPFATLSKIELFDNVDWEFNNVCSGEDSRLQFQLALKAKKVFYSTKCNYNYVQHNASITGKMNYFNELEVEKFYSSLKDFQRKHQFDKATIDIIVCQWVMRFHFFLAQYFAKNNNINQTCLLISRIFQDNLLQIQENDILGRQLLEKCKVLASGNFDNYKKIASSQIITFILSDLNSLISQKASKDQLLEKVKIFKEYYRYYKTSTYQELPKSTQISSFILGNCGIQIYQLFRRLI